MRLLVRQGFFFVLSGGAAFFADLGSYFLLTRSSDYLAMHYVATSVMTACLGVTVSYFMNQATTFRPSGSVSLVRYRRFLLVYGFGVIFQNIFLALFVVTLFVPDILAKVLAIGLVGAGWNFTLAKTWVFRYTVSNTTVEKYGY